ADTFAQRFDHRQDALQRPFVDDEFGVAGVTMNVEEHRNGASGEPGSDQAADIGVEYVEAGRQARADIEAAPVDRFDFDKDGKAFALGAGAAKAGHAGERLGHGYCASAGAASASPSSAASSASRASISACASASAASWAAWRSISR